MKNLINNIKFESKKLTSYTEDELDTQIEKIKRKASNEGLENIIVDWFALVQEISERKIGLCFKF